MAGIDFSIQEGEIFGFLGPSGSGKTTTINILTGQLKADAGTAHVLSETVEDLKVEVLEQIGIVSDTSGFYEKMSLYNNLKAYAMIFGVDMKKVDELLQKVGIYDSRNKVGTAWFTKSTTQKAACASPWWANTSISPTATNR